MSRVFTDMELQLAENHLAQRMHDVIALRTRVSNSTGVMDLIAGHGCGAERRVRLTTQEVTRLARMLDAWVLAQTGKLP